MNLLTDNWINTDKGCISLRTLLCTDLGYKIRINRPDLEIATIIMIEAIVQTVVLPNLQNQDIEYNHDTPLIENEYDIVIKQHFDKFEHNIFMQWPLDPVLILGVLQSKLEPNIQHKTLHFIIPGMVDKMSTSPSSQCFTHTLDEISKMCLSCVLPFLFMRHLTSFPSSEYPSGIVTGIMTLFWDEEEDLRKNIWHNIIPIDDILVGSPIWGGPPVVNPERTTLNTQNMTLFETLLPANAFVELVWGNGECAVCGNSGTAAVGINCLPRRLSIKGRCMHTLTPVNTSPKVTGNGCIRQFDITSLPCFAYNTPNIEPARVIMSMANHGNRHLSITGYKKDNDKVDGFMYGLYKKGDKITMSDNAENYKATMDKIYRTLKKVETRLGVKLSPAIKEIIKNNVHISLESLIRVGVKIDDIIINKAFNESIDLINNNLYAAAIKKVWGMSL